MKLSKNQKINNFLNKVESTTPEQLESIHLIRELFNQTNSGLTEDVKYGGLVYLKSATLIGGIFSYKKHLSIEFSNGVDFTDPKGLLEGSGKKRRHLKIFNIEDIKNKQVSFFIKQVINS